MVDLEVKFWNFVPCFNFELYGFRSFFQCKMRAIFEFIELAPSEEIALLEMLTVTMSFDP